MDDHSLGVPGIPEEGWTNGAPFLLAFNEAPSAQKRRLKAIPTTYKGCAFRSRLEARWAVFLDTLNVDWRYEHDPFPLSPTGEGYLPDFYLPEHSSWIEIKPTAPDRDAQRKTCLFNCGLAYDPVRSHERAYIVYGDIPWPHPKRGTSWDLLPTGKTERARP